MIEPDLSPHRIAIAALVLSAAGLVGIAVNEGYSDKAYPDPVKGTAVATIGFGTTAGVKMGDTITPSRAMVRVLDDVHRFETDIKKCVKVPLYQYEYDAFVDLAYNIGSGAFCKSTIVKRANAGDYAGACEAILMWTKVGDQDCRTSKACSGLWKRRLKTRAQCLGQDAGVIK